VLADDAQGKRVCDWIENEITSLGPEALRRVMRGITRHLSPDDVGHLQSLVAQHRPQSLLPAGGAAARDLTPQLVYHNVQLLDVKDVARLKRVSRVWRQTIRSPECITALVLPTFSLKAQQMRFMDWARAQPDNTFTRVTTLTVPDTYKVTEIKFFVQRACKTLRSVHSASVTKPLWKYIVKDCPKLEHMVVPCTGLADMFLWETLPSRLFSQLQTFTPPQDSSAPADVTKRNIDDWFKEPTTLTSLHLRRSWWGGIDHKDEKRSYIEELFPHLVPKLQHLSLWYPTTHHAGHRLENDIMLKQPPINLQSLTVVNASALVLPPPLPLRLGGAAARAPHAADVTTTYVSPLQQLLTSCQELRHVELVLNERSRWDDQAVLPAALCTHVVQPLGALPWLETLKLDRCCLDDTPEWHVLFRRLKRASFALARAKSLACLASASRLETLVFASGPDCADIVWSDYQAGLSQQHVMYDLFCQELARAPALKHLQLQVTMKASSWAKYLLAPGVPLERLELPGMPGYLTPAYASVFGLNKTLQHLNFAARHHQTLKDAKSMLDEMLAGPLKQTLKTLTLPLSLQGHIDEQVAGVDVYYAVQAR
jgi:hypothetical protein